jgi:F-type H+-transporting ATPase subunit gamma
VSASKLKRAQSRLLQARSTLGFLDGLLQRILASVGALDHPLCRAKEGRPTAVVIFTSDTGLCGSYNNNLIQLAESFLKRDSLAGTQLVFIGKKGHRYFTKRGFQAAESYLDLAGRPDLAKAEAIGRTLIEGFLGGRWGGVKLLYSAFQSATVYRPQLTDWLPIIIRPQASGLRPQADYILEPSPEAIFQTLLPRWTLATFQRVMLEALTSEHSARMIAMKNATDNAEELLGDLTRQRNRIRQAGITKEISEIVGTAEALK